MKIRVTFHNHPCTNHTGRDYTISDEECEECGSCRCDASVRCCRQDCHTPFCPLCGDELERPYCYACDGEECGNCGGDTYEADCDVFYTGTVTAEWVNGTLSNYRASTGHPHLNDS